MVREKRFEMRVDAGRLVRWQRMARLYGIPLALYVTLRVDGMVDLARPGDDVPGRRRRPRRPRPRTLHTGRRRS